MERQVYGWMNEPERMALRRWAFGAKCLEVGCYEGLSTMQMAMTADHITTVDTFDGRATGRERDTAEAFRLNMIACDSADKVLAIKGESSKVLPSLEGPFGFVFIDGDHDYKQVREDATNGRALLAEGGCLGFHDYDDGHPGVVQTVDELRADGMWCVEQTGSLVVLKEGQKPGPKKVKIALLYPSYDGWFMHAGIIPSAKYTHTIIKNGTSIITSTFNKMLCEVMNSEEEFDYLAMLHADMVPGMGWLDQLIEELEVNRLDMLSAVVPIKDGRGVTSTGLQVIGTQWAVRRLTLHEIYDEWELPTTFKAEDIPGRQPDQGLLLNSGCWVMRWDRAWKRGLHFRQQDRITWSTSEQKYGPESASEDWDWSRQLLMRGCRLGATTRVQLVHQFPAFHNREAWGTWKTDEDFFKEEAVIEALT
jgi:hypothetical protein